MTEDKRANDIFGLLDKWRHFPDYQLERRADIFFSLYLSDVVSKHFGVALEKEVIPEFPIKRDLIWPEKPTNKSVKVDYLLTARDRSKVYFVELKTDSKSRREAQDTYLVRSQKLGFKPILEGLKAIMRSTAAHQKYHHLANQLSALGFWTLPDDIENYLFPEPRSGLTKQLEAIKLADLDTEIEVVYIQPNKDDGNPCIDFEQFAQHVEGCGDPFSLRFSESLRRWREPAGAFCPNARENEVLTWT